MENQAIENTSENKLVIPYDKDRKNLTFYDTYVDMNGDVVKYDDIAVFQSAAFNNSSMIYIYFSKSDSSLCIISYCTEIVSAFTSGKKVTG